MNRISWSSVTLVGMAIMSLATSLLADEPAGTAAGKIIFSSNRSGAWRIWSVRPDGSELKALTEPAGDFHDVDPVFSPDGQQILFTSTRGGATGVWRIQSTGGKAERICDGDQAEWSPDGRSIVFRREDKIYIRNLAACRDVQISPADLVHPSGPAWSPDGKWIALACRVVDANAIFLLPAGGGQAVKVYDKKGACEPHWSPDGKRLVYETETHICTIDPDGKKNRSVTYFGGVQRYGRFSPDGKAIVYCQGASERGPWELYVIPALGGTPTRLTEEGSDMTPDWK